MSHRERKFASPKEVNFKKPFLVKCISDYSSLQNSVETAIPSLIQVPINQAALGYER